MKLADLRKEAYRIAEVSTTRQLKAGYSEIKPLDMRYKVSWEKAITVLKSIKARAIKAKEEPAPGFENWLNNPPEDLKDLFAEAESALGAFDSKLKKAKRLTKTAKAMASSLDEFAEASLTEAQQLISSTEGIEDISKQANLN